MKGYNQSIIVFGVALAWWLAVPIVTAIIIGNFFDQQFNIKPWGLVFAISFAFLVSNAGIIRQGLKLMKRLEQEDALKKDLMKKDNHESK
ncbi:MAG: hypothetical protein A2729_00640 [Candidatus Buchananbacteria bacterium RIFCSPHIGHO2_01_FULL_39_14]|uniref:AtpZ/AtpI family protein n=2 Tax=Candidatus Buchananiibacteriota TaxID=1817903 RepID=A0A1G1YQA3_9BACT|nr:MAG: hypothetical protein A2729_00640 [Candidatus Buchananbacteria bacterium RIFCSPHIGHO2_01_FULL_39_14]OGY48697.1 MAG: hypothetical protein A3D39_04465 [Candidatus Buchananbacteria bacterium RIFCSPHIGHO2_02_FULL_39_17]OGY54528.1 MAG: hypothetical protein A2912_00250 [Candidatus Buchananbacteria bacterium RIFCSPLOWO2_01_FULL_40_23b]